MPIGSIRFLLETAIESDPVGDKIDQAAAELLGDRDFSKVIPLKIVVPTPPKSDDG